MTPVFTRREIAEKENKMSEQHNQQTGELSIDELDAVAGGAANVVNSSRSNVKNNLTVSTGTTDSTPTMAPTDTAMPAGVGTLVTNP